MVLIWADGDIGHRDVGLQKTMTQLLKIIQTLLWAVSYRNHFLSTVQWSMNLLHRCIRKPRACSIWKRSTPISCGFRVKCHVSSHWCATSCEVHFLSFGRCVRNEWTNKQRVYKHCCIEKVVQCSAIEYKTVFNHCFCLNKCFATFGQDWTALDIL